MAAQLTFQGIGSANSTATEVELNTLALRRKIKPQDIRLLGSYSAGGTYTYVNALTAQPTPTSNAILAAFQAPVSPGYLVLVRKVMVSFALQQAATGTGANVQYTIGLCLVDNYLSQYVTAQDNAATATAPTQLSPSFTKLDVTFADSVSNFIMPPSAASAHATTLLAPSAQTQVANVIPTVSTANPLATLTAWGVNATTTQLIHYKPLLDQQVDRHPLVLEPSNGFAVVLLSTTPTFATAAGTLVFGITVNWEELLMRDYDL